MVDHLPDEAVDGVAILLGEISDGRIDPAEQAWFWAREWQAGEGKADGDLAAGRAARYGEQTKPLGADAA